MDGSWAAEKLQSKEEGHFLWGCLQLLHHRSGGHLPLCTVLHAGHATQGWVIWVHENKQESSRTPCAGLRNPVFYVPQFIHKTVCTDQKRKWQIFGLLLKMLTYEIPVILNKIGCTKSHEIQWIFHTSCFVFLCISVCVCITSVCVYRDYQQAQKASSVVSACPLTSPRWRSYRSWNTAGVKTQIRGRPFRRSSSW